MGSQEESIFPLIVALLARIFFLKIYNQKNIYKLSYVYRLKSVQYFI